MLFRSRSAASGPRWGEGEEISKAWSFAVDHSFDHRLFAFSVLLLRPFGYNSEICINSINNRSRWDSHVDMPLSKNLAGASLAPLVQAPPKSWDTVDAQWSPSFANPMRLGREEPACLFVMAVVKFVFSDHCRMKTHPSTSPSSKKTAISSRYSSTISATWRSTIKKDFYCAR